MVLIIIGVAAPTFYYVTGGIANVQQIFQHQNEEPVIEEPVIEEPVIEEPVIEEKPPILIIPHPPFAVIEGPREFERNSPVTFDGSKSYDPNGDENLSYFWILDDGDVYTYFEPKITHTYVNAGHHTVILLVTDSTDMVDTIRTSITIIP